MAFVHSAWYVAALASEVGQEFMVRTLLGEPVLMFRAGDGQVVALNDRCPHRFAPLHKGRREGDTVVCPYHGLVFNTKGVCIHSCHGDGSIPPQARTRSYPAIERHRVIWVWMGDPAQADATLIPDYGFVDQGPDEGIFTGYLNTRGNYLLMIDNILDLSHADFLHPALLGTDTAVASQRPKVNEANRGFRIGWEWSESRVMIIFQLGLPGVDLTDGWLWVEWEPVGLMKLHSGNTPTGKSRDQGVSLTAFHCMTPESETTTHYFYAVRRDYLDDADNINENMSLATRQAFATEDSPMIEAVQNYMTGSDLWPMKPAILSSDVGGVLARRAISRLIRAEAD